MLLISLVTVVVGIALTTHRHVPAPVSLTDAPATDDEGAQEWRRMIWRGSDGRIPSGALANAMAELAARQNVAADGATAGVTRSSWTWAGPSNVGGRVHDLVFHPTTPTTMFAGTNTGGIWRTVNGGTSWTAVTDYLPQFTVQSIRFQPGNPLTMYAATGSNVHPGAGILKSTDGGTTWAVLPSTAGFGFGFVNQLSVSANGQILLAATDQGVYRSVDGGTTWTRTLRPPSPYSTPQTQACDGAAGVDWWFCVAAEVRFLPGNNQAAVASTVTGKSYYTVDGGVTWTLSTFTPALNLFAGDMSFGTSATNPLLVYLAIDVGGVYRSTDGGLTFTQRCATCTAIGGGSFKNILWIDPTNSDYVVMAGLVAQRSSDGGQTFVTSNHVGHADVYSVKSHPAFDGVTQKTIYFGNDGGVYAAPDVYAAMSAPGEGLAASLNNSLGNTEFYTVTASADGSVIVGGMQDSGAQRLTPASLNTQSVYDGFGDAYAAAMDRTTPEHLYMVGDAQSSRMVFRHARFVATQAGYYAPISGQIGSSRTCKAAPYRIDDVCGIARVAMVPPLVIDPNDPNRLWYGARSLWRTDDARAVLTDTAGPAWKSLSAPIISGAFEGYMTALAVTPGNSNRVWRAHTLYLPGYQVESHVFVSSDALADAPTWTRVGAATLPSRMATSLLVDGADPLVAYVTFGGFASGNIWKTTDGGVTWQARSGTGATALPSAPVRSLTRHPSRPRWLYAGTELGVFASNDDGATWSAQSIGPAAVPVTTFVWIGQRLLISTYGRGLYTVTPELPATTLTVSPAALTFAATKAGADGAIASVSAAQMVTVGVSGVAATWTATTTASWLQVTGGTGTGAGTFRVGIINPNNVIGASTQLTATVTLSASGAESVTLPVTLNVRQQTTGTSAPVGQVDTPVQSTTGAQGAIGMTGWVVDDVGVANVRLYRQCLSFEATAQPSPCVTVLGTSVVLLGDASVIPGARPDVEAVYPTLPAANSAGWGFLILSNLLPNITTSAPAGGVGTFILYAVATDQEGNQRLLGRTINDTTPTTVTVANDTIAKPFGAIDTPTQGQTVSGTLNNFGWALTPDSNAVADATDILVPTAGTSINVIVDGVSLGTATFNLCRGTVGNPVPAGTLCDDDVSSIFRGAGLYRNLDAARGPIGLRTINTTTLSNGLHTIQWGVSDSASRGEGIGSRYFTVLNSSTDSVVADRAQQVTGDARATPVADLTIYGRTGFDFGRALVPVERADGVATIRVPEMGRVELQIPGVKDVALLANGDVRRAPVGLAIHEAEGVVTWSVGPGYLGTYRLRVERLADHVLVDVEVVPMMAAEEPLRMHLDRAEVTGAAVVLHGWALDPHAETGAGIGAVHVWARQRGVADGTPVFLGVANLGTSRPDVASAHGARFTNAGFVFEGVLDVGEWDVTAYVWNVRTQRFEDARIVVVTVR